MTMTAFTLVEAVIVLVRVRYEGKAFFHYRKDVFFFTQNAQNYVKREATQNIEARTTDGIARFCEFCGFCVKLSETFF